MTKVVFNPLLSNLKAFQAMSHGERRAAGRRARQEAASSGYPNKAGKKVVKLLKDEKARLTLFSA